MTTNTYKFNQHYVEAILKNKGIEDVTAEEVTDMYGILMKGEDKEWSESDHGVIEQNLDRLVEEVRGYKARKDEVADVEQPVTECNASADATPDAPVEASQPSVETAQERVHAEFPPSSLNQFMMCPASWYMQQGIQDEHGEAAEEGTMLHGILAEGKPLDGLTDEQASCIEECRGFETVMTDGMDVQHEIRLTLNGDDGELTYGYADVVAVSKEKGKAVVIDWKFGRNKVNPEGNFQLAAYAGAVMQMYGVTEVEAAIFQPRIGWHASKVFSNLGAIVRNVQAIIRACRSDSMTMNPGEACRYCKAKASCIAFRRMGSALSVAKPETLSAMTDETLSSLIDAGKQASAFIKAAEDEARRRIMLHGRCGAWTLEEKQGNREIEDICKARLAVSEELTNSEFLDCCKCSAAGLIGALAAKIDAKTKKEQKAKAEEILQDVITRGKPTQVLKRVEA